MSDASETWEERALAAERTVDVLAKKVLALYAGQGASIIHEQLAKAKERQREGLQRRALLTIRAEELARHSRSLEAQVVARTRELVRILDHVTSGLLLLDRQGLVQPGYTRSCQALLGRQNLAGGKGVDALRIEERRKRAHFELALDQVFTDCLPDEVSTSLLAGRYRVDERVLQVDAKAIRNGADIEYVLLTLSDTTELEQARTEARLNQTLVGLLRQKPAFALLVAECRELFSTCRDSIALDDHASVARALHTIKGNAAAFGLTDVVDVAHELEERSPVEVDSIDRLEQTLRAFLDAHRSVLEVDYARGGLADRPMEGVTLTCADSMLGPVESYVERLAKQLGKRAFCRVSGMQTLVDARTFGPISHAIKHLVRNAVDHGIEREDERGSKPATGLVLISLSEVAQAWDVVVEDDGRGIDRDALLEAAVAKGIAHAGSHVLDEQAVLGLIFLDGLTTRSEVTDVSGRGIGMAAVRAAVEAIGGTIRVHSRRDVGTRITLSIPKPAALRIHAPPDHPQSHTDAGDDPSRSLLRR